MLKSIMERNVPASYLVEKYYQIKELSMEEKNQVKDHMVEEIEKNYPLREKQHQPH